MSSSLDKLRALTSRLEEKLVEKENDAAAAKPKVEEEVQKEPVQTPVPKTQIIEQAAEQATEKNVTPAPQTPAVSKKSRAADTSTFEKTRRDNIDRVNVLYNKLKIFEKSPDFENVFMYKAMNLSGIGLKEEDFGQVREGKYIQIIAITYEPDKNGKKKAKNISLGYFGKAETLDAGLKNEIIEFVLRWRYEKAFQNVEHYKDLISRVEVPAGTLF